MSTRFSIAAGEDWDAFVSLAIEQNCGGIECLAGIPGSVGGTPVQNVGAYGQEVAETIRLVRVLDLQTLRLHGTKSQQSADLLIGAAFSIALTEAAISLRVLTMCLEMALMQYVPMQI